MLQNNIYHDNSLKKYSSPIKENLFDYYSTHPTSSEKAVVKKLSFKEAFQMNDKFFFNNDISSRVMSINHEIMGKTPKKDLNLELMNQNKQIFEIDLSRGDNFKFIKGNYNRNIFDKESSLNKYNNETNAFKENKEAENNLKRFLDISNKNLDKMIAKTKGIDKKERNYRYEDKENFNYNGYKQNFNGADLLKNY